jgi:hypothetical protein
MYTRRRKYEYIFLGSTARPTRKAENLAALCEPIIQKMWNAQYLTNLWTSTPVLRRVLFYFYIRYQSKLKCNAIYVRGLGGLCFCIMSRFPYFLAIGSYMAVKLSALLACRTLLPRNILWYSFLSEAK